MKRNYSYYTVWILLLVLLCSITITRRWERSVIVWDVKHYYLYLPALFIEKDVRLTFIDTKADFYQDKVWDYKTTKGQRIIKMSGGLAFLYAPFFFIAHGLAHLFPSLGPPNGYTPVYSIGLQLSLLFYAGIALWYSRKLLIAFDFSERVVVLTLVILVLGTNFYYYAFVEVMPHVYNAALCALFTWYVFQYNKTKTFQYLWYAGIAIGCISWIRPTNALWILLFLLYPASSGKEVLTHLRFWMLPRREWIPLVLPLMVCMGMQGAYWYTVTGSPLYWSYEGERFFFLHPHVVEGLVGFRKGWWVYTPCMFVACIGMFRLVQQEPKWRIAFVTLIPLYLYITFSWWNWWYGGSLSARPLVDIYPWFALGLASSLSWIESARTIGRLYVGRAVLLFFTLYGLFYTVQYEREILHWDSMTYAAWKKGWGLLHLTEEYQNAWERPDEEHQRIYGWERPIEERK